MSESAPEISHSVEPSPKPGSLTAVRMRIAGALVANTKRMGEAGLNDREKPKAEKLNDRHLWQLGMLDSLVTTRMVATNSLDPAQTERTMTAQQGAELTQKWIGDVLDNPNPNKDPEDMPDDVAREYAEDLLVKLSDEATSHLIINTQ